MDKILALAEDVWFKVLGPVADLFDVHFAPCSKRSRDLLDAQTGLEEARKVRQEVAAMLTDQLN